MANFNKSPDFRAGLTFIDSGIAILRDAVMIEKISPQPRLYEIAQTIDSDETQPFVKIAQGLRLLNSHPDIVEHKVSVMVAAISRLATTEDRLGSESAVDEILRSLPLHMMRKTEISGYSQTEIANAQGVLKEDHRLATARYRRALYGSVHAPIPEPIVISEPPIVISET